VGPAAGQAGNGRAAGHQGGRHREIDLAHLGVHGQADDVVVDFALP